MPSSSSSVNPSARWSGCSGATCVKGRSLPRAEDRSRLRFLPVSRHQLISIRRARLDDLDFLFELDNGAEVEPYLGGRASLDRESLLAEIERSEAEPQDYGRFVIEADGERAGVLGFEVANRRSRIAHLERLAVQPAFRGRRIADEAARLFQVLLFDGLGYHRRSEEHTSELQSRGHLV